MTATALSNVPGFFPKPNWVVDRLMAYLTGEEYKVLDVLLRKILGYKEKRLAREDHVSLSQIEELTGFGRPQVASALDILIQVGIILKLPCSKADKQKGTLYGLPDEPQIDFDWLTERREQAAQKGRNRVAKAALASAQKRQDATQVLIGGGTVDVLPQNEGWYGGRTTPSTSTVPPGSTVDVHTKETFKETFKETYALLAQDGHASLEFPSPEMPEGGETAVTEVAPEKGFGIGQESRSETKSVPPVAKAKRGPKYSQAENARRYELAAAYAQATAGVLKLEGNDVGIFRNAIDPVADAMPSLTADELAGMYVWYSETYPERAELPRKTQTICEYLLAYRAAGAQRPQPGTFTANTPLSVVTAYFDQQPIAWFYVTLAGFKPAEYWKVGNWSGEVLLANLRSQYAATANANDVLLNSAVGEQYRAYLAAKRLEKESA